MVHLPLFISVSLLIRTSLLAAGSPLSTEIIPWWSPPAELTSRFETSAKILADRGLEGEILSKLTMLHGPTLTETDKTMFGPILMGILTMANVELGQWLRRGMKSEIQEEKSQLEKHQAQVGGQSKESSKKIEVNIDPIRTNVLGNILRAAAIGFVAVSSQAPTVSRRDTGLDHFYATEPYPFPLQGLVVYWLTSASYTLIQNSTFALFDRHRANKVKKADDQD